MRIREAVPILAERLQEQGIILFVGAGLSRASGLPGWKELFAPLCKKLECPDEEDYPAVATAVINEDIHNRREIVEHIVREIGEVRFTLGENHRLIKRLPLRIIITTNYDNLLEDLYGATNLKRIYSDAGMAYFDPRSSKIQLIYLHGDINHPDHMVVSSIDYQGFSDSHSNMVLRLKTLLQEYTFLFIGYSANDPNLHAIFDHFKLTYKEAARRHFIALPAPGKVRQAELRSRFGIEPIVLQDYKELTVFLKELVDVYENPGKMGEPLEEKEVDAPTAKAFVDDIIDREKKALEAARYRIPVGFKPVKPFNVPGEDPHFTGREAEIELLEKALLEKQTVGVTGLFGMGGIGKTSLAKHVAHRLHRQGHFKDGICWHRLEARKFADSLGEVADAFGAFWLKEIPEPAVQTRYFQSMIQDLDVLFVLDNAEYIDNIPPLLDLSRNHPVLITSRRHLGGLAEVLDIHRLDADRSLELFIKTWKQEDDETEVKTIAASLANGEVETLRFLCTDLLGGLPLAITIAASVMRYKKTDIPGFKRLLEDKQLSLLTDPNNVYKTEEKDKNVRLSFDLSFDQLPAGGLEQSLFAVMGIFGGEDFCREALYEIFKDEEKEAVDSAVETLEQLSMIQVRQGGGNQRLYLHPLLRQYALEKLPSFMEEAAAYEKTAGYYLALVKNNPQALDYEWQNALYFAGWCLAHAREKDGLFLILKIDRFLYKAGKWSGREEALKRALEVADRLEDTTYLYDLNNRLQDLYARQGRHLERREVIQQLSDCCRRFRELEKHIPWVNYFLADSFLNLHEMEAAYEANLENIKDSLFYGEKEALGGVYKNLGNMYKRSGLLQDALHFYKANLAIKEELHSRENQIRAVDDIGDLYLDLKKFTEALAWLNRYEAELADNPHRELEADLYVRYFFYYLETGDIEKAQDYLKRYREAVEDFAAVTAAAGLTYYEARLDQAKGNHRQAISSFEKACRFYRDIGREDESGGCCLDIGICYLKLGNIRQARENLLAGEEIFRQYRMAPLSRCRFEAYLAVLEVRSAYDERAVRLINRVKNTYGQMGVEEHRELREIEAEIGDEIGAERYKELLNRLKKGEGGAETIDFGAGCLQVDPPGKEITSPIDGRRMALIPSGFVESDHYGHTLYLYPFYMDQYPVTNSDYRAFITETALEPPPHWQEGKIPPAVEDHPVVGITYDEAMAYARWAGKDLPLKEEWEVAAGIVEERKPPLPAEKINESDFITGGDDHSFILKMEIPPHLLEFDEKMFLQLLAGSISLTGEEKKRIIKSIPGMSQYQIDELIRIFSKEKRKFEELSLLEIKKTNDEHQKLLKGHPKKIKTSPVTRFKEKCSPYGIVDLAGNVFEYTQSFSTPGERDRTVILKGFSWLRHSYHKKDDIGDHHYSLAFQKWADVGFRCVRRIYRQEEAKRFIDTGARPEDWQSRWLYQRAEHLFAALSSGYFYEDRQPAVERGAALCQELLRLSPGHKRAVYLLARFRCSSCDLPGFKVFFDTTLYPLLEHEKETSTFNWYPLHDIFSAVAAAVDEESVVTRHQRLKEVTGKIDRLLGKIENSLLTASLRLSQRDTLKSLDFLLNRYEGRFDFFQYAVILFLCLMKIRVDAELRSLAEIADIAVELITPQIERGTGSMAAVKVSSRGLAPLTDILVEWAGEKPPQKSAGKNLKLSRQSFHIPQLDSGESRILETAVDAPKTGDFPLSLALKYTNPAAPEGQQQSREIVEAHIRVTEPPAAGVKQEITVDNPYFTGRPIQDSRMYFGRRDVLERIKQRLGPNNIIILYGQRRTGKTSTLYQLKNLIYKDIAVPVLLDIQSMLGEDGSFFFYRMAADLHDILKREIHAASNLPEPADDDFKDHPQYKLEIFLKEALEEVKGRPIIYLIDEFDGLFQMIRERRTEPTVLDNLRSIMQHHQQVWFLLAGTHLIKQAAADSRSALFNIATYEKIGALAETDARALISEPVKGMVEYEPFTIDKIISLTNCNPYFIQAVCFELIYYLKTRGQRKATLDSLNVVVDKILDKGSSHFDDFWRYLPGVECLFLSLLAENVREYEVFISIDRVREFCQGRFDPGTDVNKIVSRLKEKDIIIQKNVMGKTHIGFFMELFKRWVVMHHPPDSYE